MRLSFLGQHNLKELLGFVGSWESLESWTNNSRGYINRTDQIYFDFNCKGPLLPTKYFNPQQELPTK